MQGQRYAGWICPPPTKVSLDSHGGCVHLKFSGRECLRVFDAQYVAATSVAGHVLSCVPGFKCGVDEQVRRFPRR